MDKDWNPDVSQADLISSVYTAEVEDINRPLPHDTQDNRSKKRVFGIPRRAPVYSNPDDYENKYPEDKYGEEIGPTARVWRTCFDEAQKADGELLEGWKDTTDTLLVFAGLFSAVVATFVVQTSTALQPDFTQATASLLLETNSLLRALVNQTLLNGLPPSPLDPVADFSPSGNDRWINGLWFTSLSISLAAAFIAILVKQWMQHYQSLVFGAPQEQVRIRQFRYLGVERWHMPLIISTLPMLLHLALLLYFAGLILFLWPLDSPIAHATITIAALAYAFYFLSTLLPLWYPICPYKTPLSSLLAEIISSVDLRSTFIMRLLRRILYPSLESNDRSSISSKPLESRSQALYRMRDEEKRAVKNIADEMDAHALVWLYRTSSNPTVTSIVAQAISGLSLDFQHSAKGILKDVVTFDEHTVEAATFKQAYLQSQHKQVERFVRAFHQLGKDIPYSWNLDTSSMIMREKIDNPVSYLAAYDYSQRRDQPPGSLLLTVVLRESLRHSDFRTPSQCWSHAFDVLNNVLRSSFQSLNCLQPPFSDLQIPMILEYFCSLSIINDHGQRTPAASGAEWGSYSILHGAPLVWAEIAPQICSALTAAIGVLCNEEHFPLRDEMWRILGTVIYLLSEKINTQDAMTVGAEGDEIIHAVSGLRFAVQKLVESDKFWTHAPSSTSRDKCCEAIFYPVLWLSWLSESSPWITWAGELMEWFLQSNIEANWFIEESSMSHPYSYFSDGTADLYKLFMEKDGLSRIERERLGFEFLRHYLDGLQFSRWKGFAADRDRQVEYLFTLDNLTRIVREFILKNDEGVPSEPVQGLDGWGGRESICCNLVTRLFKLRSPDQYPDSYGQYLNPLRELQSESGESWELWEPDVTDSQVPLLFDVKHSASIPIKILNGGYNALRQVRTTITGCRSEIEAGASNV